MVDASISPNKNEASQVYKLSRSEILAVCALFLSLIGGGVRIFRNSSLDSERYAQQVKNELNQALVHSEARNRTLITDLENRTAKNFSDAETRTNRQMNRVEASINKRLDVHDSQIAELAKGKRW
jgi:hypothetical protein